MCGTDIASGLSCSLNIFADTTDLGHENPAERDSMVFLESTHYV